MAGVTRALPRVLAHAQITADQATITTATDVTGLSVTFTAGSRPVWLEFWAAQWLQFTTSGDAAFIITDTVPNEWGRMSSTKTSGQHGGPVLVRVRLVTLTPGTTYTFKARASASAGSLTLKAGPENSVNGPAYLRAYEE